MIEGIDVMLEAEFQVWVLERAQLAGWMCFHSYISHTAPKGRKGIRRTNPGFPDLVLCKGDSVIFAELKSQKGRVKSEQWDWLKILTGLDKGETTSVVNAEIKYRGVIWRPSDMTEIENILESCNG